MAAFKEHVTFSSILGVGYGAALWYSGFEWIHASLAGALCGVSGMLPDLDSDSGKPVKELFGLAAVAMPLLLLHRLQNSGLTPEGIILLGGGLYLSIRFGAAWLFKHFTVHRGMFHSIPAAVIAAEVVFLAHHCQEPRGGLVLGGGVLIGFLSHLLLDELYSVDAHGLKIRLNKAAGSALKFASDSVPATVMTWLILGGLTYLVGIDQGYFRPLHLSVDYPATKEPGNRKGIPANLPAPPSDSRLQS
jgi:hypothetical protein